MERRVFPEGADTKGRPYDDLRWSRFKHLAPAEMFTVVAEHVFPFLRTLGGDDSTYAHHMKDARFTIPDAGAAGQGGGPARRRADGGPRHQGRPVRVHARQDRQRRAERPVPHTAPHHPADGGDDRAAAHRHHLRSGLRHGGLPGGGGRGICASDTRTSCTTRSCASTSTTGCSTASTSTTPCCASAA